MYVKDLIQKLLNYNPDARIDININDHYSSRIQINRDFCTINGIKQELVILEAL